MIPPKTAATPWPAPESPRDYDHLLADERRLGLLAYAAKRGALPPAVPPPPAIRWQPLHTGTARTWVAVATASGPRHAKAQPVRTEKPQPVRPDTWMRWTVLDGPLAAVLLLTLAAIVHLTAARDIVVQQRWYVEAQIWLAVHERHSCHEFPAPRHARAVTAPAPSWTVDTLTLNNVVTEWTTAARIGAGR